MDEQGRQGREITKIAREVTHFTTRTMKTEGVGPSEFELLHLVRHCPGISQTEAAESLDIDKGAAARRTASLLAKGYLHRERDLRDARRMRLYATERAEELKHSGSEIEAACYTVLLDALTPEERDTFLALLDTVYRRCKTERRANFPSFTAACGGEEEHHAPESKD